MDLLQELLQAELERLFALAEIQAIVRDYLGTAPREIADDRAGKAAYVRRLLAWADRDGAAPALVDVILALKGTAVDPRLRQQRARRPSEDLEPGATIGPYAIEELIGSGGVAVVYRASGAGGQVALRVLRGDHAFDRVALHRYMAAQRMMRDVSHPAFQRPVDIGAADGRYYVAYPFAPGRTARSLLRDGPVPFEVARRVVSPVVEALGALHARGLAHGDVKLENVIVSGDPGSETVTLVGAGADRLAGRGTAGMEEAGRLAGFGTPKSAAPEVIRGAPADARSDFYAVGVLLYEMLAGVPPFVDRTAADVAVKHLAVEAEPPGARNPRGRISRRVDAMVLRCLRKDPAARFQTAEALLGEIEAAGRETRDVAERAKAVKQATVEEVQDWSDQFMADPNNEEVYSELEAAARGAGAWDVVLQALGVAAEDAPRDRRKDLLFRAGRIHEAEIRDFEQAEAAYRSILELDPSDELAMVAIEDLNRTAGRFDRLVDLLLERAGRADSAVQKREAMLEAARVYERDLNDHAKALTVVLQVYKEVPQEQNLLDRIESLAAASGGWQEVLAELGEVVCGPSDPPLVAGLCARLGTWCAEHVGRPDFAMRYFQQALTIDPRSEPALAGLAQIYRSTRKWTELAQVLERLAEIVTIPARRRDIRAEIAVMYEERLDDREKAIEMYRSVVAEDPTHPQAAAALERLCYKLERWKDLSDLLEKRAGAVSDPKTRGEILLALAEVREDRLEQIEAAAEAYREALGIDPHSVDALKGLERIYARRGQFRDLLGVLERQVEIAGTARQKVGLFERIGAIHEKEFMDGAAAIAAFGKVLDLDRDNAGAIAALARLYRAEKRWSEYVETLDQQCGLSPDAAGKLECLRAQASTMIHHLDLPGPALDVLGRILELAPGDREALRETAACARKLGDSRRAAGALRKLAAATDGAEKARTLVELGGLLDTEINDHAAAVDAYRAALDADPSNAAAAAALRTVYAEKGDYQATIEMLQREIDAADGDLARSRLHVQMGRIFREDIGDSDRALACFEKALETDRTSIEAAEPLAELYRERDRWEDASRIYEAFADSAAALPVRSAGELFLRQGQAAERLGNLDRAEKAYLKAREARPDDIEVPRRIAAVRLALGRHEDARAILKELLLRFEADMAPQDRVRAHMDLAGAARAMGDSASALRDVDETLRLDPGLREAIEVRAAIHEERGEWAEVVADLRRLMEKAPDEKRFDLLVRVGDILRERLGDNEKAARSYHAALEIQPEHRAVLHKLIAVYQATEQWSRVVEAILRIADLLDDRKMLAKYYLTAARVNAEKLGHKDDAVTYYDLALDNDPENLAVFDDMVRLLTDVQRWSDIERAYRKMIGRMEKAGGDALARANMWHALAEVCHHRLNHVGDAITAYEAALRLDPENRPWMESLVRLYGDDLRHADKAVRLHRQLLDMNPYRAESYQLLSRIHVARERWDEAWCFSSALNSLGLAEDTEKEIYLHYRDDQPLQVAEPISDERWRRYVHHESLDEMITGIFATIQPAYLKRHGKALKTYGVSDSDRLDVEARGERLTWAASEVARTFGMEPPPLYVREDRAGALALAEVDPPAILAGKTIREMAEHEMEDLKVVAFLLGRHMAYCRPGFFMRTVLQSGTALSTWFLAGVRRIINTFPVPPNLAQPVADAVEALWRNLDRTATDKLGDQVAAFLSAVGGGLDLKRWAHAVDFTVDAAGFVACNDVDIASRTVKSSPAEPWMAPAKDRLRELIRYAVGENYFTLRDRMGVRIVIDAGSGGGG